ncbi:MAG: hypothetical protein AB1414_15090, partial [bacterium]
MVISYQFCKRSGGVTKGDVEIKEILLKKLKLVETNRNLWKFVVSHNQFLPISINFNLFLLSYLH